MSALVEFRRQTNIEKYSSSPVNITTNLLAYWSLEESSGTMYDQLNGVNSLLTIDYEGNIRPFNILYDIGAFEYSSEIINNDISILTINKFAIA